MCADQNTHKGCCCLTAGHVRHRLSLWPGGVVAHVTHNTDDRHQGRARVGTDANASADRVAQRPIAAGHALAQDDCPRSAKAVLDIECAALPERDPQRAKVFVRDAGEQHEGLDGLRRRPLNCETDPPQDRCRNALRGRDSVDSRENPQAIGELLEELDTRLWCRIGVRRQPDGGREYAGRVEAERRGRHCPKATGQ
jgi:hypothetical protein